MYLWRWKLTVINVDVDVVRHDNGVNVCVFVLSLCILSTQYATCLQEAVVQDSCQMLALCALMRWFVAGSSPFSGRRLFLVKDNVT